MLVYDQQMVIDRLSRELPQQNREFFRAIDPNFQNLYLNSIQYKKNKRSEDQASHLLILGDLGILDRSRRGEKQVWMRWVYEQWQLGKQIFVLVPYSLDWFPESLKSIVQPIAWQGNQVRAIEGDIAAEDLIKKMFVYAYPAIRIELQLLRALRMMIPNADDASLESIFWQHRYLADNALLGAKNDRPSKENAFRHLFEELPEASRKMILETIRSYRQDPTSITDWYLEFSNLSENSRTLIEEYQNDTCGMIETIDRYRERLERGQLELGDRDRLTWYATRASEDALNTEEVKKSIRFFREKLLPEKNRHRSTRMSEVIPDGTARKLVLQATIDGLECNPGMDLWESASIVGVGSTSRIIELHVPRAELPKEKEVSPERAFWKSGKKPDWVSAFGTDEYGLWCEFQVPRHDGTGAVTQRMRWIKPGNFMMGSPEDEAGRYEDESPRHRVTLTQGFWLADTPCTQELWMAVTKGKNPSNFSGYRNPVEQVSWVDCQAWLKGLGEVHPLLQPSLPTEAQWEYACRAGSTSEYCFGDGEKDLEKYAWYDKNSGNTTHAVGEKLPNAWGLYDVHGNVWEWCSDWFAKYSVYNALDPIGPSKGTFRVLRGGTWTYPARAMRSACRIRNEPGNRDNIQGFRIAGSVLGAEPSERASSVQARVNDTTPVRDPAEARFWKVGKKPDWVSAFGKDEYGLWCEFQLPSFWPDTEAKSEDRTGTEPLGFVTQRMRWINPGAFMMGSPETTSDLWIGDETKHEVTLTQGFWIATTPCTQELWLSVDRKWNPNKFSERRHPVDGISWEDCQAWIKKLKQYVPLMNPGLPSEAQWEYACRAGASGEYCFGDSEDELGDYAWYGSNSGNGPHSVGQKLPNAWGVYDMHGNIWEWCHDWYGKFSSESVIDPVGLEKGQLRVTRGGGWNSPARDLRSSCRFRGAPNDRLNFLGFRLSISAQEAEPGTERASSVQVIVKPTEPVGDPRERAFWKSGKKPDWVSAFGKDRFGLWYEFQLPNRWPYTQPKSKDRTGPESQNFVTQRMRWIKPGTFTMGSATSTKELWIGDERQHEVTLTRGFWMADTPCTQGLWVGIGNSENPSVFQGISNPVESVSWKDCQAWLKELGEVHALMQPGLPTEAQWEYACRSGSTSAYCFGDEAQELEKYAWYDKNGNRRTHPVGEKLPNNWGLHDVHGNVWEWCQDWLGKYTQSAALDPTGPAKGTSRVVRGGSWLAPARYLRSACRFRFDAGDRGYDLGFRLLSSALVAEPSEGAMEPEAEPGTERARIGSADVEYAFLQSIDLDATGETTPEDEFSEIEVNAYTSIRVVSDQEGYQFDRFEKPDWAVEFGSDAYGLYSVFEVEPETKGIPVRQKMRWIPPGRFAMGSAEGNANAFNSEKPQHEVILTHGYWMFDTPCTQRLWTALMGDNPSYFHDPDRPVEQVRWEDAVGFAQKLNEWFGKRNKKPLSKRVIGWSELSFRLPTEAEWEYACRAGTNTDTYLGDLEILGDANAPLLDRLGWYGGNSGREYDLQKSYSLEQDWSKNRQYPDKVGGTRKVCGKEPNGWGLYDMLGNVWEWCEDWYGEYTAKRATDPVGPSKGTARVVRGGSWDSPARLLRSACRVGYDPGVRINDLGFRLLSSARQVESTESGQGDSRSKRIV
jgi:formylglycine-generating enzyme required for sulfatase activity